jgi:hypothetical protein
MTVNIQRVTPDGLSINDATSSRCLVQILGNSTKQKTVVSPGSSFSLPRDLPR